MEELTLEQFVELEPNMGSVYGILVENGRFYLLGRMMAKDTEPIFVSPSSKENEINMGGLSNVSNGHIGIEFERLVMSLEGYGKMQYVYRRENGRLVDKHDEAFANAYEKFASVVMEGNSNKDGNGACSIIQMTEEEMKGACDSLSDGRYIFVVGLAN